MWRYSTRVAWFAMPAWIWRTRRWNRSCRRSWRVPPHREGRAGNSRRGRAQRMDNSAEIIALFSPPPPTPPDEFCRCDAVTPVKLMSALGENPIHCLDCNLEVDLARLPLTREVARRIAAWRNIYDAIDRLWL